MSFRKLSLSVGWLCAVVLFGSFALHADRARADSGAEFRCTIDVVVETRGSTGAVSRENYQKEFFLVEGGVFSDDFSTRTRFKFFDAWLTKENGVVTLEAAWYADVTVFNSVDFGTTVMLADGKKSGQSSAAHTFYTSGSRTTTTWTLTIEEN